MITYKGHIKIYEDGVLSYQKHNSGTLDLSRLFAKAVAGEYDISLAPNYIDITDPYYRSQLTLKAFISLRHIEKDLEIVKSDNYEYSGRVENYRAHLEATITKDMFNISTTNSKLLVLMDSSGNILAYTNIDEYINSWAEQDTFIVQEKQVKKYIKNITVSWEMELIYSLVEIEELG